MEPVEKAILQRDPVLCSACRRAKLPKWQKSPQSQTSLVHLRMTYADLFELKIACSKKLGHLEKGRIGRTTVQPGKKAINTIRRAESTYFN